MARTIRLYWILDAQQPDVLDALREAGLLRQVPHEEPEGDVLRDGRPADEGPSRLEQYRRLMEHGAWRRIGGRMRQVRMA